MKVQATLVPLILSSVVSARSVGSWLGDQVTIKTSGPGAADAPSVPGENPLFFCSDDLDNDILQIDHVDLTPNPPEAGSTLVIEAEGTLSQPVEEGALVHIQVKYGLITLIRQTVDLCEQVKNVDLECPLEKGPMKLKKEVELPNQIPPGKYTVNAVVVTADEDPITCLDAKVIFPRR